MPPAKSVEVISCEKCGCTFFEHIEANRFATIPTIPDYAPNEIHRIKLHVLRCIGCANLVLPPIDVSSTLNSVKQLYTELVQETIPSSEQAKKITGTRKTLQVIESWDTAIPIFSR